MMVAEMAPLAAGGSSRTRPARPILVQRAIHPSPRKRSTPEAGNSPITRQITGATTRIVRRQKRQWTLDLSRRQKYKRSRHLPGRTTKIRHRGTRDTPSWGSRG